MTDIAKVPLHVLRSKISYIPQESLLTSGTLRDALDISGEKDDHELYAAMMRVHLDVGEASPFSSLDTLVSAGKIKSWSCVEEDGALISSFGTNRVRTSASFFGGDFR